MRHFEQKSNNSYLAIIALFYVVFILYTMSTLSLNLLSEQLLLAIKMEQETSTFQNLLRHYSLEELSNELKDENKKKAFWINIYNSYFLILRKEKNITKPAIYTQKLFSIAGQKWSLDDVEHGILRKYRYKYSQGRFANPLVSKLIKKLAVSKIDYRIHFALNCGAESCPPIAFYKPEKINQQLDLATQSFLESESDFDNNKKVVHTTALFQWFLADFGYKKGIQEIYQQHLNKDISTYQIRYKKYSWTEVLDNFVA
jgi:hypothetical protein